LSNINVQIISAITAAEFHSEMNKHWKLPQLNCFQKLLEVKRLLKASKAQD